MVDKSLTQLLGRTDIYLIDQILKGRYQRSDHILDAGCGSGRNLLWFINNNFSVYGIDRSLNAIEQIHDSYPQLANHFIVGDLEGMPYSDNQFHHIISSAVLHFSKSIGHFWNLMLEHTRVLKPGGSLFIRMASNIGIEEAIKPIGNGVFQIPDHSTRFLLTRAMADLLLKRCNLKMEEPLKTTNVNDIRCMSTLVLTKQ